MSAVDGWGAPKQPTLFNTPGNLVDPSFAHLGAMTADEALMRHAAAKKELDKFKALEMDLRKFCAKVIVAAPQEGMNNVELGNGYVAKVGIKYNYALDKDNEKIEKCLDQFSRLSNEGNFIADRLVTWTPNLSITEYRKLEVEATTSLPHKQMFDLFKTVLTITEGAPTLEIKEPKAKK